MECVHVHHINTFVHLLIFLWNGLVTCEERWLGNQRWTNVNYILSALELFQCYKQSRYTKLLVWCGASSCGFVHWACEHKQIIWISLSDLVPVAFLVVIIKRRKLLLLFKVMGQRSRSLAMLYGCLLSRQEADETVWTRTVKLHFHTHQFQIVHML